MTANNSGLEMGESYLVPGFGLDFRDQLPGKTYVRIGNDCLIGAQFVFETSEGNVEIGNRVLLAHATIICKTSVFIDDDVMIEDGVCLYDHTSHALDYRERQKDIKTVVDDHRNGKRFVESKDWSVVVAKPIRIGKNACIGRNSTILKGVAVGEGAVVMPYSVVTTNVEPWTTVLGNPAVPVLQIGIVRKEPSTMEK